MSDVREKAIEAAARAIALQYYICQPKDPGLSPEDMVDLDFDLVDGRPWLEQAELSIEAFYDVMLEAGRKMTPRALTQEMINVNYNDRFPVPSPGTCCDQWSKMWDAAP